MIQKLMAHALMVDQMLSLHKQLPQARTPHERTALERQIEATDRQIDALVYELYGLKEEIRIVWEGDEGHRSWTSLENSTAFNLIC